MCSMMVNTRYYEDTWKRPNPNWAEGGWGWRPAREGDPQQMNGSLSGWLGEWVRGQGVSVRENSIEVELVGFIGRSALLIVFRTECVLIGCWTKESPEEDRRNGKRWDWVVNRGLILKSPGKTCQGI